MARRPRAASGKELEMKKLVTLAMFLLLALGYVACGGSSSPTAPTQPVATTPSPGPAPMPTPTPY
jgi:ABC-type glycerol-3-phosphate transport system substrate-binding protein